MSGRSKNHTLKGGMSPYSLSMGVPTPGRNLAIYCYIHSLSVHHHEAEVCRENGRRTCKLYQRRTSCVFGGRRRLAFVSHRLAWEWER